ncbi:MAG: hypothetical protein ACOCQG_01215 [Candidatus Nanoarchaeia archaeon]
MSSTIPVFSFLIFILIFGGAIYLLNDRAEPLDEDEIIYAGKWYGEDGTNITIRESGTGDYSTSGSSFSFASVLIKNDTLEMDIIVTSKVFDINISPAKSGDKTLMMLNGEEFTKKEE